MSPGGPRRSRSASTVSSRAAGLGDHREVDIAGRGIRAARRAAVEPDGTRAWLKRARFAAHRGENSLEPLVLSREERVQGTGQRVDPPHAVEAGTPGPQTVDHARIDQVSQDQASVLRGETRPCPILSLSYHSRAEA